MNRIKALIGQLILYLFPKNCFEELLIKLNVMHPECSRLVLSRFLGVGIIAGSVAVKVPQIVKIYRAKTGQGVSLSGQMLEIFGGTAMAAYSYASLFPFGTYGDSLFVVLQTLVICVLILEYDGRLSAALLGLVLYGVLVVVLFGGLVPMVVLSVLQMANIPVCVMARGIQASTNFRNGSTGQLSIVTVFLMFAGTLARIFTSFQETSDGLMIFTYVVAATMNGILFAQILWYWGSTGKKKMM